MKALKKCPMKKIDPVLRHGRARPCASSRQCQRTTQQHRQPKKARTAVTSQPLFFAAVVKELPSMVKP
jgi:hypothetical protein